MCITLLFSGCASGATTELSNRLIIEAIGIDAAENGYKVSILALNTLQTGSAGSTDSPDGITKVFTANGTSVADAFAQIDLLSSQIPLYSQARVLIIGKDIAENEPLSALNFFIREYTTRDDIPIVMAEKTANEIISADLGKNMMVSKVIDNLLTSGKRNGKTVLVPLYSFISHLLNKTDTAFLPILKTEENEQKKEAIYAAGIALFANNNYTATITGSIMQGFLYANNLIDSALLEIDYNEQLVSLAVRKSKAKILIQKNDFSAFSLEITLSCDIVEQNSIQQIFDEQDIQKIKVLAQEKIKKQIEDFLYYSLQVCGCDCIGIGKRIHHRLPIHFNAISENFTSFLKNTRYSIKAEASVRRPGREVLSAK